MTDYELLAAQARAFAASSHPVSALNNILALLYWQMEDVNWVGLYFVSGQTIYLGPFQGKPACASIPWGKGVVGTCAQTGSPLLVPDVHAFPGHIACDSASASEAVFPLKKNGKTVAVLDIDSPVPDHFPPSCILALEKISRVLEGLL